jgi:hypothetical protein
MEVTKTSAPVKDQELHVVEEDLFEDFKTEQSTLRVLRCIS